MDSSLKERGERRIEQARSQLRAHGAVAYILSPGDNHYYLSGSPETQMTPRHTFFVLPLKGEPFLFMSTNNVNNARGVAWVDKFITWSDSDDPVRALASALKEVDTGPEATILIEDQMWASFVFELQELLDAKLELASEALMPLRRTKDKEELSSVEEAASIADEVSEQVRSRNMVGMTENELAAEIDYLMRNAGAEDTAFDTAVASGPNSSKPSYTVGQREIQPGDPVIMDFGAKVDHYLSDQTRTVVYGGEPPEGFVDAFDVAREAQEQAIKALRPGVEAKEIDNIARSIIDDAGYGENFLHVTGHGIGLGIHEPPFLMSGSYVGTGNEIQLEPGMVVTIEPGIYTDEWGIRIEDDVVITENGSRRISNSNHGWEPLET